MSRSFIAHSFNTSLKKLTLIQDKMWVNIHKICRRGKGMDIWGVCHNLERHWLVPPYELNNKPLKYNSSKNPCKLNTVSRLLNVALLIGTVNKKRSYRLTLNNYHVLGDVGLSQLPWHMSVQLNLTFFCHIPNIVFNGNLTIRNIFTSIM